ncbi:MAG: hypothetical protein H6Q74_1882 [Firmicutes bacterium]|nr:hypothetical protein [Bacillota bacterium]
MDKELVWLKEISDVAGASGYEDRVKGLLKERLGKIDQKSYRELLG